jgi:hypothetical protein
VKTLVVPEGGELPSDEELAAMAAAERDTAAEADAGPAAAAEPAGPPVATEPEAAA